MPSSLDHILSAIDHRNIKRLITTPCRQAEHAYRAAHLVPKTYAEFQNECASYWIFLSKSFYRARSFNYPAEFALGFARQCIDRAFYNMGGMRYAFFKAQHETFGIVKYYLTSTFIQDAIDKYVTSILRTKVNPMDYNEIHTLMVAYVRRFHVRLESSGDLPFMIANYEAVLKSHARHHEALDMDRAVGAVIGGGN